MQSGKSPPKPYNNACPQICNQTHHMMTPRAASRPKESRVNKSQTTLYTSPHNLSMSTRDDEKIEEYITAAICEEDSVPTKTPSSISQGPNLFENRQPFLFSSEKKSNLIGAPILLGMRGPRRKPFLIRLFQNGKALISPF